MEVRAAGVCGSDIHMWRDHQSWAIKLPLVLGHEFCGTIAASGADVEGFQSRRSRGGGDGGRSLRQLRLLPFRRLQSMPASARLRRAHRWRLHPIRHRAASDPASHPGQRVIRAGVADRADLRRLQRPGGEDARRPPRRYRRHPRSRSHRHDGALHGQAARRRRDHHARHQCR